MPLSQDALDRPPLNPADAANTVNAADAGTHAEALEASPRDVLKRVVSASLVTAFEMFDFTVFGYFAAMIGAKFFPASDPMTSLLLAVGTFGVGFFMRPLGALALGAYADRVGRRVALTRTVWLAGLGTAAIALCPDYATIGVAAPLVVVLARALQGFALGGDIGVAAAYLLEAGPASRRGARLNWQIASQGAAALLGAVFGLVLTHRLSPQALEAWGWRVPFWFGLLVLPVGVYLRRRLHDIDDIDDKNDTRDTPREPRAPAAPPFVELWREHGRTLGLAMLMVMGQTIPVYAIVYFMPSYVIRVMHLPASTGFAVSALSALLLFALPPFVGRLLDRLPRRKPVALAGIAATTLLSTPVFLLIDSVRSLPAMLVGVGLISVSMTFSAGTVALLVLEALPARARASGLALAYALSVALFGGTAQFIVTALVKWSGNPLAAAWYVTPACCVSLCAVALFKERREEG
ncbi:MFS transporter [Paraburkholderia sp.]|uniref:MFS transporter n=1 Tax=Paraburkholderia sp. TaxID=1926495 RepID=UPI00286F692E|nr:MFS transporter [Paraburkholderia sp.]